MATPLTVGGKASTVLPAGELHAAVKRYALGLGWPLVVKEGNVYLPANQGIVGLVMTGGLGGEVNAEFTRRGLCAPVLALPGRAVRWVFLVETPAALCSTLPARVDLVHGLRHLPLPPSSTEHSSVRWVCEPEGESRGIPSFMPALGAVRQVALAGSL